jgi:hypothetical protein
MSMAVVASAVLLSACSASAPVLGRMERSDETFSGHVTGSGYSGGSGELTLVSSRQATCNGHFTYTSRRRGEGVLQCTDGRTGAFHLSGVGASGTGAGELDGRRFTFNFGEASS